MKLFSRRLCWFFVASTALLLFSACTSLSRIPGQAVSGRVVGYVTSWSIYARGFELAQTPVNYLTDVNYAFATIDADSRLALMDPNADTQKILGAEPEGLWFHGNFAQLAGLKKRHPGVKFLISVGGGAEQARRFSQLSANETLRARFADSVSAFIVKYGFDGVDIDWEYPTAAERHNFTALIAALRKSLDGAASEPGYFLLSIAVGASEARLSNIDFTAISPLISYANLMAYDYHGPWDANTGHAMALYADPLDPGVRAGWVSGRYNAASAVRFCLGQGLPSAKLVLGVPLYGRAWFVTDRTSDGRFSSALKERPPGTWQTGNYDYQDIVGMVHNGLGLLYHDINSASTWYFDDKSGLFISFDDEWSLYAKTRFVKNMQLGGIAFWELSADRSGDQIKTASRELLNH